jgi:hypothetical protein
VKKDPLFFSEISREIASQRADSPQKTTRRHKMKSGTAISSSRLLFCKHCLQKSRREEEMFC